MATSSIANVRGIIDAINACIQAAGGTVSSYEPNTQGVIDALVDLRVALQGGGTGTQSVSALTPGTSGEVLAKGDAVYVKKSDGKIYKASNVFNRENAQVLGLAKENVASADANVTVVSRGPIEGLSGLSPGFEYYLDTNGNITTTAPISGGIYSTPIGQAISATILDVHPGVPIYLI
jgi:hypothetical protein